METLAANYDALICQEHNLEKKNWNFFIYSFHKICSSSNKIYKKPKFKTDSQ